MSSVIVRRKRVKQLVGIGQFWRHRKTRKAIYISRCYRKDETVFYVDFAPGQVMAVDVQSCGDSASLKRMSFRELGLEYELIGSAERNLI